jgi:hypothetical protein
VLAVYFDTGNIVFEDGRGGDLGQGRGVDVSLSKTKRIGEIGGGWRERRNKMGNREGIH